MKAGTVLVSAGLAILLHPGCVGTAQQSPAPAPSKGSPFHTVTFASPLPNSERVSLVRILANPEAMDGQAVSVGGYMHLEFEGDQLCLHRDDVEQMIVTNCVWLSLPRRDEALSLNDRYVGVQGVVNAKSRGHMGLFQATIQGVTSLGAVSRADLEQQLKSERP